MLQKLLGRIFPFIPLGLGFLLIVLQMKGGTADTRLPLEMMFVLIISCLVSWIFSIAGMLIYEENLPAYYRQIFKIFSIIYLAPAIILALFIPWTLIFNLAVFIAGFIIMKNTGCR